MQPSNEKIVTVAVAPNEMTADIWRQVLAEEGIVAALKPGGAGYSFGTNALNEVYILVREDQAEVARELINDFESEEDESSSSGT